jgi:hypothetical protein
LQVACCSSARSICNADIVFCTEATLEAIHPFAKDALGNLGLPVV